MKIKLGKTIEEIELEEANRIRELESEVQKRNEERDRRLRELIKKKKKDSRVVIIVASVIAFFLIVFGTYNTFFKKTYNQKEIGQIAQQSIPNFPTSGLNGYIRNNFTTLFFNSVTYQTNDKSGIENVTPKLDSLSIDRVIQTNSKLARVYFSMDISTKTRDITNGDGKVTTKGKIETKRYSFYLPVEYYYNFKNNKPVSAGYRPIAPLNMYTLKNVDSDKIQTDNQYLRFESEQYDENTIASAKVKVDKTLSDLFEGKDTSQDFLVPLQFNSFGAKYKGITEFTFYKQANSMGYNAKVTYLIETKEGYKYTNTSYLAIRKSGKSWTINGIL